MLVVVALAFRWSIRPLDDIRWELRSPKGQVFHTGTDASGLPVIDDAVKAAIKASSGDRTGQYPTRSVTKSSDAAKSRRV